MHMQVITFGLDGLTLSAFHELCDSLAGTWADIPGLVSKVWIENVETNTYGGIYTWESRAAMEAYLQSELFQAVASNPQFSNAASQDFAVIQSPTRITRGLAAVPA